jgi:CheY-like chemotaxis protein
VAEPAAGPQQSATILVIDDDHDVRRVLADQLGELGHLVQSVASGQEGLDLMRRERFDLLLLDFAMPGLNGAQIAEQARKIEPGQRILFVSGYADTAAIERAVGEARVLRKPFRAADIAQAIRQALS